MATIPPKFVKIEGDTSSYVVVSGDTVGAAIHKLGTSFRDFERNVVELHASYSSWEKLAPTKPDPIKDRVPMPEDDAVLSNHAANAARPGHRKLTTNPKKLRRKLRRR